MQELHTHRRLDGSIDIDFYRQRGLMERRAVMTNFARGVSKMHRGVIAALLLAAALHSALAAVERSRAH